MSKNIIAFYKGHQGDILLIRTCNVSNLCILKEVFNNLSKNKINTYSLKNLTGFIFADVEDVRLDNNRNYINIEFQNGLINWSQNTDQWDNCEGLIEGLIDNIEIPKCNKSQYLVDDDNRILVIVEFVT